MKARQLGISTIVAGYIAWMLLFHRDKNVLVVATKLNTAANLVRKVKGIIKHLPPWLAIANIDIDNKNSEYIRNKCEKIREGKTEKQLLKMMVVPEEVPYSVPVVIMSNLKGSIKEDY